MSNYIETKKNRQFVIDPTIIASLERDMGIIGGTHTLRQRHQ
jgi:hypothetical protein